MTGFKEIYEMVRNKDYENALKVERVVINRTELKQIVMARDLLNGAKELLKEAKTKPQEKAAEFLARYATDLLKPGDTPTARALVEALLEIAELLKKGEAAEAARRMEQLALAIEIATVRGMRV